MVDYCYWHYCTRGLFTLLHTWVVYIIAHVACYLFQCGRGENVLQMAHITLRVGNMSMCVSDQITQYGPRNLHYMLI